MNRPILTTVEKTNELPVLIIDKSGIVGVDLAITLSQTNNVVLASTKKITHEHIAHLSFEKKLPKLPDIAYSLIIVIYNGENSIVSHIQELLDKARLDGARFLFLPSFATYRTGLVNQILSCQNTAVLVLGDVFGSRYANAYHIPNMLLHTAKHKKQLPLPNDGLSHIYPVFIGDVVEQVIRIGFHQTKSKQRFFLFPQHPPTILSFSRSLQKFDPLLSVSFHPGVDAITGAPPTEEGEYLLPSSYSVDPALRHVLQNDLIPETLVKLHTSSNISPSSPPPLVTVRSLLIASVLSFILLPLIS